MGFVPLQRRRVTARLPRVQEHGLTVRGAAAKESHSAFGTRPMSIEIKMPALSPTMEEGTLAKWLVKEGDTVRSGDLMAEIETRQGDDGVRGGRRRRDRQDPRPRRHRQCEGGHGDRGAGGRGRGRLRRRCARARSGPCQGRGARSGSDARARCARARARQRRRPLGRPGQGEPARAPDRRGQRASTSRVSPDRAPMAASSRPMSRARSRAPRPRRSLPLPTAAPAPAAAPAEAQARVVRRHDPARGGEALQHPQDDRAAPHRIEADRPAHLSDGRHPPRTRCSSCAASSTPRSRRAASSSRSTTC